MAHPAHITFNERHKVAVFRYQSAAAALDWASSPVDDTGAAPAESSSRSKGPGAFHDTASFDAWLAYARTGNGPGADRARALAERIAARVLGATRPAIEWRRSPVPEGALDIPAYLAGVPDPFRAPRRVTRPAVGRVLRIVLNLSASGATSTETVSRKGAATLALAYALERAGLPCQIDVADTYSGGSSHDPLALPDTPRITWDVNTTDGRRVRVGRTIHTFTMKAAGQPADLEILAAWTACADGLRRGSFSLQERHRASCVALSSTYGSPWTLPEDLAGDAPVTATHTDHAQTQWTTDDDAVEWCLAECRRLGVRTT